MDFLSRLITGSGATASTKQRANTTTERLSSFRRLCNALQSIWRNGASLGEGDAASLHVAGLLDRLNSILTEESRKAAPHSCLAYAASTQIYIIIAKLALSSTSGDIIHASRHFFHLLINGEADGVIDSKIFARSVVDLVQKFTGPTGFYEGEASLVELLFEIATKIRLEPDILPAWFYPERRLALPRGGSSDVRRSQFPLFFILVDYVHFDGSTGDFARTALLYLTETASRSKPLEQWMIESDLAPQMASGLSALYSRLSRQSPGLTKESLPILSFFDASTEYQYDLDDQVKDMHQDVRAFLSYLAFWQDTLNHCKSIEVRDTLLDHFQILFVEQLLYPSLLESSDVQGGSTAAVILHLCRILGSVEHQQLTNRMLKYLFAAHGDAATNFSLKREGSAVSISRRKSMDMLEKRAQENDNPSPDLFNLLDLIVFSLRSKHIQTVISSLRLVTILLNRHHHHIRHELMDLRPPSTFESHQNLNDLNNTMMTLFDLVNSISQITTLDQSYQGALTDGQILLERHSCLLQSVSGDGNPDHSSTVVSTESKVFIALSDLLKSWFSNDSLINLELSEAFTTLAACQHVLFRSWLEALTDILTQLVQHVKHWRNDFVEWDAFYSIQRVELGSETDKEATPVKLPAPDNHRSPQSVTPTKSSPILGPKAGHRKAISMDIRSIGSRIAQSPQASPLQYSSYPGEATTSPLTQRAASDHSALSTTLLETQIPLPTSNEPAEEGLSFAIKTRLKLKDAKSGIESPGGESGTATPVVQKQDTVRTSASLRHILTQAVILQEFILELAAMLQIRATLFDEVDLS